MIDLPMRERRLALAIEAVEDVDYIFIDCPPSLGLLTVNAAVAAQGLLVPIQCEFYALEGLGLLTHTLALLRRDLNPQLTIAGIVMTLFDGRLALAHQVVDEVRKRFADELLTPLIPRNVRLCEAPTHGLPVNLYDPTCRGAIAYGELAVSLDRRLSQWSTPLIAAGIHAGGP
jgi:chromosome partitioning protein